MGKVPKRQFCKTNTIIWNQFGSQKLQNIQFIWPNNSTAKDLSEKIINFQGESFILLKCGKAFLFLSHKVFFGILAGGWSGRSEDPESRQSVNKMTTRASQNARHLPTIELHAAHWVWVTLLRCSSINTEGDSQISHRLECKRSSF